MLWAIFGVVAGLFHAGYLISNQYLKMNGRTVMVIMRGMITLTLLPFVFIVPPVDNSLFYLIVVGSAFLAFYADSALLAAIKDHGAGPVSRIFALTIPAAFVYWSVLKPSSLFELMEKPVAGCGTIAAMALTTFFIFELKKCPVSVVVLKRMIPIILFMFAPFDIINKTAMMTAGKESTMIAAFSYIFFQSLGVMAIVTVQSLYKKLRNKTDNSVAAAILQSDPKALLTRRIFVGSSAVAFFFIAYLFFKNMGMTDTPNPAFITLLVGVSPFWIILMNRMMKYRDDFDIKSGIGLIFSALALIFFVTLSQS